MRNASRNCAVACAISKESRSTLSDYARPLASDGEQARSTANVFADAKAGVTGPPTEAAYPFSGSCLANRSSSRASSARDRAMVSSLDRICARNASRSLRALSIRARERMTASRSGSIVMAGSVAPNVLPSQIGTAGDRKPRRLASQGFHDDFAHPSPKRPFGATNLLSIRRAVAPLCGTPYRREMSSEGMPHPPPEVIA
jgi:hypothetical protein